MTDVLEFTDFEREWHKAERDRYRQLINQLKREFALARQASGRAYQPAAKQVRG